VVVTRVSSEDFEIVKKIAGFALKRAGLGQIKLAPVNNVEAPLDIRAEFFDFIECRPSAIQRISRMDL
jgi:hypothetical protein